jgi:peptidoglycan/LPS O-acetylase OafA/YrhL
MLWWPMGTARFGVDAFFVLSGFFVVQSWRSVRAKSGSSFAALRSFGRRRALRILPAYWVSLVVLVPLVAPAVLRNPKQLFLLSTINQYVERTLVDKVNVVLWSLTTEWHFYLLVPLVAYAMYRLGAWKVYVACVAIAVAWVAYGPPFDLPAAFVFGRIDQFVAGAVAADIVQRLQHGDLPLVARFARAPGVLASCAVALVAIGTYHGSTYGSPRGNTFDMFMHPLVAAIVAVAVVSLCARADDHPSVLQSRPLRLAGLVSYSLYLWHAPILIYAMRWAGVAAPLGARDAVVLAFALALSVAVAVLSYTLVERPFLQRKATPPPAPVLEVRRPAPERERERELARVS